MTDQPLGRLERVDLRDIWVSEATSFTPWLARPENLAVLSDALNIDLELEAQERAVGPFRADILCKDISTDRWVLIENQLERTDHTHLGQLLTYASGLGHPSLRQRRAALQNHRCRAIRAIVWRRLRHRPRTPLTVRQAAEVNRRRLSVVGLWACVAHSTSTDCARRSGAGSSEYYQRRGR